MIPDRDAGARPPLTLEFAFVLALLAPLLGLLLNLPVQASTYLVLAMLAGTPAVSFIAAIGAMSQLPLTTTLADMLGAHVRAAQDRR